MKGWPPSSSCLRRQLNDISPFYSWSSLDLPASPGDTPRWKPLQYQLARQWAPLAVLTRLVADGAGTGTGAPTVQVGQPGVQVCLPPPDLKAVVCQH